MWSVFFNHIFAFSTSCSYVSEKSILTMNLDYMSHVKSINLTARSEILEDSEYCFTNSVKFWFNIILKFHASERLSLITSNFLLMISVTNSWTEENMNLITRVEVDISYAYLEYLKFVSKISFKFQKNILTSDLFQKFEDYLWVWFSHQKIFLRRMISHKN